MRGRERASRTSKPSLARLSPCTSGDMPKPVVPEPAMPVPREMVAGKHAGKRFGLCAGPVEVGHEW